MAELRVLGKLTYLKTNISIKKRNVLVNSRFELQVKPGVMATQYFRRNFLLNLYGEEKNIAGLFPPAA